MKPRTKMRLGISGLVYTMVNAVIFGAGIITVLTVPVFRENLALSILVVVVAAFVLAVPVSWLIAPRLRPKNWKRRYAVNRS